jgi:hypothetical protein
MGGDGGVDQIAAKAAKARERANFVGSSEPRVSDDIGNQNRRELPGLDH